MEAQRHEYQEIPEKVLPTYKPSLLEQLRVFWSSKDNNAQVILILLALGLLVGGGAAIGITLLFPAALPLVGGFLGLAASNFLFPLFFAGVLGLLGMELAAVVELLRMSDTENKARETYLRRILITTALLGGIGLGLFLALASPALLAVFASLGGPGLLAFVLAGAAGLVASALVASLFYAVIETRNWGFSLALNDHPILFRVLLGALIAAGIGALMVLVFPGALAAFAVAVGLTVGSPLALVAGVGTVMLISAAFGISFLGFLEMMLSRKVLSFRNAVLYLIIPAAIAGAALGIFLGATVLPVLTLSLSGPAAMAVAGAIGLVASVILAAAALGAIRSYQTRVPKDTSKKSESEASKPENDEKEEEIEEKAKDRSLKDLTVLLDTGANGWENRIFKENCDFNGASYQRNQEVYYNPETSQISSDKPDDYEAAKPPKPAAYAGISDLLNGVDSKIIDRLKAGGIGSAQDPEEEVEFGDFVAADEQGPENKEGKAVSRSTAAVVDEPIDLKASHRSDNELIFRAHKTKHQTSSTKVVGKQGQWSKFQDEFGAYFYLKDGEKRAQEKPPKEWKASSQDRLPSPPPQHNHPSPIPLPLF